MTTTIQSTAEEKSSILKSRIRGLGIRENSQDYHEYIRAKKLVEDIVSTPCEYDELIRIVIDYVGI
jgi:hypothetical protein